MGGAEREKYAQGTIKILMDTDFTSDLAHFLHNIRGAQLNIGGGEALPKRYGKVTPKGRKPKKPIRLTQCRIKKNASEI